MNKIRIAVLTAHEGAAYWSRLLQCINRYGDISVQSLHGFDDEYYRSPKTRLGRFLLRVFVYILYPLKCVSRLLFFQNEYDAFLVVTSPFFLPSLSALLSKKPVICLENDIYPEALVLAGIVKHESLTEKCLRTISAYAIRHSSTVVYLCEGHRQIAQSQLYTNSNSYTIPVGAAGNEFVDSPPKEHSPPITFLYCGTLGLMHDTSTILTYLRNKRVLEGCRLEFRTSGAGKAGFEEAITDGLPSLLLDGTVALGDALEFKEWKNKMISCQVGMVFQHIGADKVIFPSKVFSVLVAGQAVLAVVSQESEIGKLVHDNDCGWVIPPGDVDALHRAFLEALNPNVLQRKRTNAFRIGHEKYAVDKLAARWRDLIHEVTRVTSSI